MTQELRLLDIPSALRSQGLTPTPVREQEELFAFDQGSGLDYLRVAVHNDSFAWCLEFQHPKASVPALRLPKGGDKGASVAAIKARLALVLRANGAEGATA